MFVGWDYNAWIQDRVSSWVPSNTIILYSIQQPKLIIKESSTKPASENTFKVTQKSEFIVEIVLQGNKELEYTLAHQTTETSILQPLSLH